MTLDSNRIGTFAITFDLIKDMDKSRWSDLMSDVVIVDAELDQDTGHIVYTAISERFSDLADIAPVPRYIATWNREEGHFTWRRL